MFRYAVLGLIGWACCAAAALAQQSSIPQQAPPASASPVASVPSNAAVPMDERLPGDHWTVEGRDAIAGTASTATSVVTDITPTDISVRANFVRADKSSGETFITYDRSWNSIRGGFWQYFPYDGNTGIQTPLTVGKTWSFQFSAVNTQAGVVWKWSGTSKVVGQETVTTKAGEFETFRIETTSASTNLKDPTRTEPLIGVTWFAPALAHWVKRSWILYNDNRLRSNNTYEVVEFGRRQ